MNETHDPKAKSWVTSANQPGCDFPIQNLPFGVFRRKNHEGGGIGIAIGDQVFDVGAWVRDQGKSSAEFALLTQPRLNALPQPLARRSGALRARHSSPCCAKMRRSGKWWRAISTA